MFEKKIPLPSETPSKPAWDKDLQRLESSLTTFGREITALFRKTLDHGEQLRDELESARDCAFPAVLALTELMEGRDSVNYGHSRRVARLCVQMANYLNWPVDRIKMMNMAGLLHDIGKVIIPDTILNKEGKFTPLEFETMKLHSSTGSRIVERLGFLGSDPVAWILSHHERWDGEGYPDGLSGEQIPIGARILCLADTYDAMTTNRRYRQKMAHWVVLDEIAQCGGRQFDPDLAIAFQDAFKEPPDLTSSKNS